MGVERHRLDAELLSEPTHADRFDVLAIRQVNRSLQHALPRHADIWHSYASPSGLRRKTEILARWCADVGRDPAEIEVATAVSSRFDAQHADQLVDLGVSLFVIEYAAPPFDLGGLRPWLRWRDELNASRR